jgi:DNA-binding transcriptional LysR family regulator
MRPSMSTHVTLRQFRYFVAVAELGSVASASRQLNIAQSAVTKAMMELEGEVGAALFERTSKGMVLTPQGHRFLASARKVLGAVTDAMHLPTESRHAPALAGRLMIGVSSLVAGYYLSDVLGRFRRACPAVEVALIEEQPAYLEHLLINGELDVALMVSNALSEPQALVAETLTRSRNRVWFSANHALAAHEEVGLADCARFEQVVLEADRIHDLMRGIWARHQLKPRTVLRTTSLEAVRSLVGAGGGVAVLPDFLYRPWTLDAEHVDARPLRDDVPTIDVGLVWRRGHALEPATAEFIQMARDLTRSARAAG